jgi:hypothetical protein
LPLMIVTHHFSSCCLLFKNISLLWIKLVYQLFFFMYICWIASFLMCLFSHHTIHVKCHFYTYQISKISDCFCSGGGWTQNLTHAKPHALKTSCFGCLFSLRHTAAYSCFPGNI